MGNTQLDMTGTKRRSKPWSGKYTGENLTG